MRHTRNLPTSERFETKNVLFLNMILFDFTFVKIDCMIDCIILYTSDTRSLHSIGSQMILADPLPLILKLIFECLINK